MHDIPHAALSEEFQRLMNGRRLKCAVFLTYSFEPDFFEEEVLPAVLPDMGLSHIATIRSVQLEDVLRSAVDHVAVYYDHGALVPGTRPAKLDVRRTPIAYRTGCFHPKNVLLLTETDEAQDNGSRPQSLIVAAMSANLTRAGWWENVEGCHIEHLEEGALSGLRDDLLRLIRRVKDASPPDVNHDALDAIREFALRLQQAKQRTTNGRFHPRLYSGGKSVVEFIDEQLGGDVSNLCLEVISPYFDKHDAAPLRALHERFVPRETRVFLPRADDGSALCEDAFYAAVRALDNVRWAKLPPELLRAGKSENAKRRTVHAKVYRFFDPNRCYEAFFIGSVNLTTPAHSTGGNFETGILLESSPKRVPDWWLEVDAKGPAVFLGSQTDDTGTPSTALAIRFDWARTSAQAYWNSPSKPGALAVEAQGAALFTIDALPAQQWQRLPNENAEALERILPSTSFLGIREDGGPPAAILVQEEGMAHKPSILFSLSAADILRYWALLTPEQRAAFIEERVGSTPEALAELGIETPPLPRGRNSMFDSFAGTYHSFHALERFVLDALEDGRQKEAEYRLLGSKYDSLPTLLDRVLKDDDAGDIVIRYTIVLCARQLVRQVEREYPEFRDGHRAKLRALKAQITRSERIRDQFTFGTPEERGAFLEWFDEWFLTRAQSVGEHA